MPLPMRTPCPPPHAPPRSKVQEAELAKAAASLSAARQQAHGSARFNERIRTYQYVVRARTHGAVGILPLAFVLAQLLRLLGRAPLRWVPCNRGAPAHCEDQHPRRPRRTGA